MEKVSKRAVNYREATGNKQCGNCGMFHGRERKCDLVLGTIYPTDMCDEWIKRESGT